MFKKPAPISKIVNSIEDLERLVLMAKKHRVDLIEVEGHRIVISRHEYPELTLPREETEDDILFHSAQ